MSSSTSSSGAGSRRDREEVIEAIVEAIERAEPEGAVDPVDVLDHTLPSPRWSENDHALPGFGEAGPECGEVTPAAIYYCSSCYSVHPKRHICYKYDCPQHAPYKIRQRVAGIEAHDTLGAGARLGALRAYLAAIRPGRQYYQGLIISPPDDWHTGSAKALDRTFGVVGEILAEMEVEGLVAYHPNRGDHEGNEDDRGEWKKRLFHGRDFEGDVADELYDSPHFHVRGAGYVDVSITAAIEERTGWVIHRLRHDVDEVTDEMVARGLLYDLSHSMVYTASDGSRRLAARWKGEHVNEQLYNHQEAEWREIVYKAAYDTLGISPPDLECDEDGEPAHRGTAFEPSPARAASTSGAAREAQISASSASRATPLPTAPASSTSTDERCGGRLRHISTLDLERLEQLDRAGRDVDELLEAYREYKEWLQGIEDPSAAPSLGDRPPPDEFPI